jgi:hypothetical protein
LHCHSIGYVVSDSSGLTSTSTRTVIVSAPANDNQATSTPSVASSSPPLAPASKDNQAATTTAISNPAYASKLAHLVERADLWVHGHIHMARDYRLGDEAGWIVCNPRGYAAMGEQSGFNPSLIIDLRAREAQILLWPSAL